MSNGSYITFFMHRVTIGCVNYAENFSYFHFFAESLHERKCHTQHRRSLQQPYLRDTESLLSLQITRRLDHNLQKRSSCSMP